MGRVSLRSLKILLAISISLLVAGFFLFAASTVQQDKSTSWKSYSHGPGFGFTYGAWTSTPDYPVHVVAGTNGIAQYMILKMAFRPFSTWVCQQSQPNVTRWIFCNNFGGGNGFNTTLLETYLQMHPVQILYTQTVIDENITIDYQLTSPMNATAVFVHMNPGWSIDYFEASQTNKTIYYPLLDYTEHANVLWKLSNVSLAVILGGAAGLVVTAILPESRGVIPPTSNNRTSSSRKYCPKCGKENLFFATNCNHCGQALHEEYQKLEATTTPH